MNEAYYPYVCKSFASYNSYDTSQSHWSYCWNKSSERGHLLFLIMMMGLPEDTWKHTYKEGGRPLPINLVWAGEDRDSSKFFSGVEDWKCVSKHTCRITGRYNKHQRIHWLVLQLHACALSSLFSLSLTVHKKPLIWMKSTSNHKIKC